jgi:hypothetical protein
VSSVVEIQFKLVSLSIQQVRLALEVAMKAQRGKYSTCSLTSALYGSIYKKYAYKNIWILKCDLPTIRLVPMSGS